MRLQLLFSVGLCGWIQEGIKPADCATAKPSIDECFGDALAHGRETYGLFWADETPFAAYSPDTHQCTDAVEGKFLSGEAYVKAVPIAGTSGGMSIVAPPQSLVLKTETAKDDKCAGLKAHLMPNPPAATDCVNEDFLATGEETGLGPITWHADGALKDLATLDFTADTSNWRANGLYLEIPADCSVQTVTYTNLLQMPGKSSDSATSMVAPALFAGALLALMQ